MTREQVIEAFNNDLDFAFRFAIDNQPGQISENISQFTEFDRVATPEDAYNISTTLASQNRWNDIKDIYTVPYNNDAPNWTGGYKKDLFPSPAPGMQTRTITDFFSGVGSFFTALGGGGQQQQTDPNTLLLLQQQQAQAEADRRRRQTTTLLIVGAVVVVGIIIAVIVSRNRSKAKAGK